MNIYATVGVWKGLAQDVRIAETRAIAEENRKQLMANYGITEKDCMADHFEHDLKVFEVSLKDIGLVRLDCPECKRFILIERERKPSGAKRCPYALCQAYLEG